MENSINSMGKSPSTNTRRSYDESPEESSWTMYFDDFLVHSSDTQHASFSSCCESSSLISDAGSSVAKKLAAQNDEIVGLNVDRGCSRLSFKKRKTKVAFFDDALEDTATSPVNSPKVCNLSQLEIKPNEKKNILSSQERGNFSGKIDERSDDHHQVDFMERENDSTELKKKGLCLVPLSMVVNYLG